MLSGISAFLPFDTYTEQTINKVMTETNNGKTTRVENYKLEEDEKEYRTDAPQRRIFLKNNAEISEKEFNNVDSKIKIYVNEFYTKGTTVKREVPTGKKGMEFKTVAWVKKDHINEITYVVLKPRVMVVSALFAINFFGYSMVYFLTK